MKYRWEKAALFVLFMLCAVLFLGREQRASAAKSEYYDLGTWVPGEKKNIYRYDVTGDGDTDSVMVKVTEKKRKIDGNISILKIYVNDVLAFQRSANDLHYWIVNFVSLKNGKVFIEISNLVLSDDVEFHALHRYEGGKLKVFYDFSDLYGDNDDGVGNCYTGIKKVRGNALYVSLSGQFSVTGAIGYDMKLIYRAGTFQRVSNRFPISYGNDKKNKWTARRKITVYQQAGGKKVAYVLKKGDKIKINAIVFRGNSIYFEVRNKNGKGKRAYIPGSMKGKYPYYFEEAHFSG